MTKRSAQVVQGTEDEAPKKRKTPNRRTLSCHPCRAHKQKCDRQIPCQSCVRYGREHECKQSPPPSAIIGMAKGSTSLPLIASLPRVEEPQDAGASRNIILRTKYPVTQLVGESRSNIHGDHGYPAIYMMTSRFPMPTLLTQHNPSQSGNYRSRPSHSIDCSAFWKVQLISLLPPRDRCDQLVSYYIDNIDLVYHSIHIPTFLHLYECLWVTETGDVDLIWLALLFTVISLAALMAPIDSLKKMGLEKATARSQAHVWHQASRQALYAGDFESRPTLTQIQVFLCTQLYWLETKNHEILHS